MTRRLRRAVALTTCSLAVLALTGCAAGFDAETEEQYAPGDGVIGEIGDLKLRNVLLVADEDNEAAAVIAAIVNDGLEDDRLEEIQVAGSDVDADLPQTVAPNELLSVSTVDGDVVAVARDIEFAAGDFVDVTFGFRQAGAITLQALVVPPQEEYEEYAPPAGSILPIG